MVRLTAAQACTLRVETFEEPDPEVLASGVTLTGRDLAGPTWWACYRVLIDTLNAIGAQIDEVPACERKLHRGAYRLIEAAIARLQRDPGAPK